MTGASALRASLTEAPSGNTSRTLGSTTTTFAPRAYRAAVAPRTACEKSYSDRNVSRSAVPLALRFISPPLSRGRPPGRDEPCAGRTLDKGYHQEALVGRHPEKQISRLAIGVVGIGHQQRQRIAKHSGRLVERDAMLLRVRACLGRIPFEDVGHCPPSPRRSRQRSSALGEGRNRASCGSMCRIVDVPPTAWGRRSASGARSSPPRRRAGRWPYASPPSSHCGKDGWSRSPSRCGELGRVVELSVAKI